MHFQDYQAEATRTDQYDAADEEGLVVTLLGLAGEVGSVLTEYKKYLRDGGAHVRYHDRVAEELGDVLWYLATVASRFGMDLGEIAAHNLAKVQDRWPTELNGGSSTGLGHISFDDFYSESERLPRELRVTFKETLTEGHPRIRLFADSKLLGDPLTDNAYYDDGYRFHDVFHLAHATILGWSPVARALLKRKRKSRPDVDEVEDGGRAIVIEEGIAAFVYDYARRHDFLKNVKSVDYGLLKTIKELTADLEVSRRSYADWERAIIEGYRVWRKVYEKRGGTVTCNFVKRRLFFRAPRKVASNRKNLTR